jgi:hypothetical protein
MLPEKIIFDFIIYLVTNAAEGTPLHGCEVRESVWNAIEADKSIAIGTAITATPAAGPGDDTLVERNVLLGVYFYVAVKAADSRLDKLAETQALAFAVAQEIRGNETLAQPGPFDSVVIPEGICSVETLALRRGYDNLDGAPRAALILPVLINRKGEMPGIDRLLNVLQIR